MRLPKSVALRIGGVAAAAAIAVTGATAVANASTAAPAQRIPTTLTISNSTPVAHKHQTTAIVSGHLTALGYNLGHEHVWLERLGAKGYWHVAQVKWTRSHGHVFFRVHVFKKAATFRLVFRGTRHFAKSVSNTDTISPATAS